MTVASEVKSVD